MAISITDLVKQNTLGQSEGFPLGLPQSWNWYQGWNSDGQLTPPAGFTAVEGWGAVYPEVGQPVSATADVQIANAKTYVHIEQTNQWVLVQDQSKLGLTGGHFVADFAGNSATAMPATALAGGVTSFDAPAAGRNDHFWYGSRGTYAAGTVDGVYVQMDMKVTDPNAHLIGMVGADWWRDASAPFLPDHSTNPAVGVTNWVELSTQWQTVGYYSMSTAQFEANLPPPLLGSAQSPPVVSPDTVPTAGANLLVNGSFESSTLAAYDTGRWGAFSSVPGWTAISGSAIELWNNLIGVDATDGQNFGELDYRGAQDGFYQDVKTVAGQKYDLSFDARSRPGFTSATTSMDVLWNGSLVATVPPGDSWQNYDFTVVGTGGQDRLTFREVAGQGSDGLGALYDNVALVAKPANTPAASMVSAADQSISLMKQFAATSFADTSSGVSTAVTGTSTNSSPDQTLALPQH